MNYRENWNFVIKEKRKYLKLSQQEVSNFIGIQRSRYSLVESGESYLNDIQFILLITILEISPLELIEINERVNKTVCEFIHYISQLLFKYKKNKSVSLERFMQEQNRIICELLK